MADFVEPYQPTRAAQAFITRITQSWTSALESFLEVGRTLLEAEKELEKKEWLDMVNNDLPFTRRTAEKLVKIASDSRITDPNNAKHLPPHWTSLHEITLLTDRQFSDGVNAGVIQPDAERKDISALVTRRKRKKTLPKRVSAFDPAAINDPANQADPHKIARNEWDQRGPIEGEPTSVSVAELSIDKELSPTEADTLETAILKFCDDHGITAKFSGNLKRLSLLHEVEQRLIQKQRDFKHDSRHNDLQQVSDAFFQFETGNTLKKNPDGTFNKNDLRHPKNPFHNFDKEQLYGYCLDLGLLTSYTPIDFLDYQSMIDMLIWRYLTGNELQKSRARETLETIAESDKWKQGRLEDILRRMGTHI